jgi:hypothetical protein
MRQNQHSAFAEQYFYGMGHNELLIGKALKSLDRNRLLLSLKFGGLHDPSGGWSGYASPQRGYGGRNRRNGQGRIRPAYRSARGANGCCGRERYPSAAMADLDTRDEHPLSLNNLG